jgi:hypothetical protein
MGDDLDMIVELEYMFESLNEMGLHVGDEI